MIFPCRHHNWHGRIVSRDPDRPWLLLFHGFLGCMESITPLARRLSSVCNPVLLDLPGHGKTHLTEGRPLPGGIDENPHPGFGVESQIEDLNTILDRLQTGTVWLYGYSMGGRLALQWAVRHPERFQGLILESSTAGLETPKERADRTRLDQERARTILDDLPGFLETWEQMPLFHPKSRLPETSALSPSKQNAIDSALSHSELCSRTPEGLAASLLGFGSGRMTPAWSSLSTLKRPVLLINGADDLKFDQLHDRMARHLPYPLRRTIDGAAHRVHKDRPDEVAREIASFLSAARL